MKIAFYVGSWPPHERASGISTYASYIVPALRKLGHEVFILAGVCGQNAEDKYTIDLARFRPRETLLTRIGRRLDPHGALVKGRSNQIIAALRVLKKHYQIDVFEMEEAFGWSAAISESQLLPVVVRIHGMWFLNRTLLDPFNKDVGNRGREKREGKALARAHLVTSPAKVILDSTKEHYHLTLPESLVIPNPIDAVRIQERWDLAACDPQSILFVGRFDSAKGGDLILRSFGALWERNRNATLTFVGPDVGVHDSVTGRRLSLRQFMQRELPSECQNQVTFLGAIDREQIATLRRRHFLTVIASQQEVMPYSALEAISFGSPIVATAVGGIPEAIADGRTGILVPSQDRTALTIGCQHLLDNPSLAAKMGEAAWVDCLQRFDPTKIAMKTLDGYAHAIDAYSREQ